MDKFLKYLENKQFVRWVLRPTKELDEYWESYLINNQSEKEHIKLARLLLLQLKPKKESQPETEVIELFSGIVDKLGQTSKRYAFRKIGVSMFKYAAVGLVFFLLGIAVFYDYQNPAGMEQVAQQYPVGQNQNDALLILTDGTNIPVSGKESKIEYENSEQIVINKTDTIATGLEPKPENLNQLIVPYGKSSSIRLPDGTLAFLSAGTSLFYPSAFNKKRREIHLIGEGFFEIAHNPEKPFVVNTAGLDVEALGTKFNLSAFPTDKVVETVLVEGKVSLKEKGFNLLKNEIILEPNQRAEYNRESTRTSITEVNVMNYISWHKGFLDFETLELNRVIKRLERYYNIKITWNDPVLGMRRITGKLTLKEEVEKVLDVLAKTASVQIIKINQSNYLIK